LYDQLFLVENPDVGDDIETIINPNSLEVLANCYIEPSLAGTKPGEKFQFERSGYFCTDLDTSGNHPVFNRTLTLKDSWAKFDQKKG
jgi:glutaminyl-tRNA synthetase